MLWTGQDGTTPSMPKTESIEKHSQQTRYEVITFFISIFYDECIIHQQDTYNSGFDKSQKFK